MVSSFLCPGKRLFVFDNIFSLPWRKEKLNNALTPSSFAVTAVFFNSRQTMQCGTTLHRDKMDSRSSFCNKIDKCLPHDAAY